MLQATAERMPSFDRLRHTLPGCHIVVPRDQPRTRSGHSHAVLTITLQDLRGAITIREMARQTQVVVPRDIDNREWRYASTWWMQPRGDEEERSTWHAAEV